MRFFFLFIFCSSTFYLSAQQKSEAALARVDSLVLHRDFDAALQLLKASENAENLDISFRSEILETITTQDSFIRAVEIFENISTADKYQAIDELSKVRCNLAFIEYLIPSAVHNTYNLTLVNQTLDLFKNSSNQDSLLLMHLLHNQGNLLYELQREHEAVAPLEKALAIAKSIDTQDSSMVGIIYSNLANPLYELGKRQRSYELIELSEQELSALKNPNLDYLQSAYLNLFSQSLQFDYFEKAELYLNKTFRFYEEHKEGITKGSPLAMDRKECSLLYNAMRLYSDLKDKEKAHETLKKATAKFSKYDDIYFRLRLAAMNSSMGEMYVDDEPEKSFQYYQRAINIFDNEKDLRYSLMFEFNLGKAYLNSGQYSETRRIANAIIQKGESINDRRLPFFYFLNGKRLLKEQKFEESLVWINKLANAINRSGVEIDVRTQEGIDSFYRTEDINFAYLLNMVAEEIESNIELSEESRIVMNGLWRMAISNFTSAFRQMAFNDKAQEEYEKMLSGLLRTDAFLNKESLTFEEVLKFSENANSRSLWEQFKLKNEGIDLIDPQLIAQEQKYRAELTDLKQRMNGPDSLSIREEIFETELAIEKIALEKRQKNTSFYRYEDFEFDLAALEQGIEEDALILKYEFLDQVLFRYSISKNDYAITQLDSLSNVQPSILKLIELVRDPSSDPVEIIQAADVVATMLLPNELPERLYFVGDGILNYLPFELLRKNERYLVQDHIISNGTSLSLLNPLDEETIVKNSIIIAPSYEAYMLSDQQLAVRGEAYNLEGALEEAQSISSIIPSKKWTHTEALKEVFLKEAGQFDLLHLSMHSFMNDDDPELSSLIFHDGENENELYISELYGLNLNAKLAVLSACNTGVGKEKTGEGMVSVNRAFTYAGVPAVVSSLWSAPDQATKELMTAFYEDLKNGSTKSEALRNAKLNYLENQRIEKLKHPYFWAGFVLHGDPEPLEFRGFELGQKIGITLLSLIGLLVIFFTLRRRVVT